MDGSKMEEAARWICICGRLVGLSFVRSNSNGHLRAVNSRKEIVMGKVLSAVVLGAVFCIGSMQAAEVVVNIRPPRVIVEHRAVRPSPHHVWIGGYHRWDGRAYVWESGRWEVPPRERAVWVAPRWQHRHDGYVF